MTSSLLSKPQLSLTSLPGRDFSSQFLNPKVFLTQHQIEQSLFFGLIFVVQPNTHTLFPKRVCCHGELLRAQSLLYLYISPPSAAWPIVAPIPPNLCPLHTIAPPKPLHPTQRGRTGKEEERERGMRVHLAVSTHTCDSNVYLCFGKGAM